MKYLTALVLMAGIVSACETKNKKRQPAQTQTQTFCDNIRHFESFYLCRTGHEIGWDNQSEPCPVLWEVMPELAPERLPDSKALKEAIDKDCKKASGDCNVSDNTCSEEQKKIKKGILDCIYNKVQSFKKERC